VISINQPPAYNQPMDMGVNQGTEQDTPYEFEQSLLNPASELDHDWLNRDAVLSNIDKTEKFEVRARVSLFSRCKY